MRLQDRYCSDSLLKKLGLNDIQTLLRYNRLRRFGHVSRNNNCINNIKEVKVAGQCGRRRTRKTWKDLLNRIEWRKNLRLNIGTMNSY